LRESCISLHLAPFALKVFSSSFSGPRALSLFLISRFPSPRVASTFPKCAPLFITFVYVPRGFLSSFPHTVFCCTLSSLVKRSSVDCRPSFPSLNPFSTAAGSLLRRKPLSAASLTFLTHFPLPLSIFLQENSRQSPLHAKRVALGLL